MDEGQQTSSVMFPYFSSNSFEFLHPGPMVDGDLELVEPDEKWVDAVLAVCRHPLTVRHSAEHALATRQHLVSFLRRCPQGHQSADFFRGRAATYHFWMHVRAGHSASAHPSSMFPATGAIAGEISLRIGSGLDLEMYYGHIGYHVYPPCRGHRYAERACRLLLPLARRHGMNGLWITCNPDNAPSRRTCERLGAKLVDVVPVPESHELYLRGDREKCRYQLNL